MQKVFLSLKCKFAVLIILYKQNYYCKKGSSRLFSQNVISFIHFSLSIYTVQSAKFRDKIESCYITMKTLILYKSNNKTNYNNKTHKKLLSNIF